MFMNFKKLLTIKVAFFGVMAAMNAQTAQVQVIHNSPDPAASAVDIFVSSTVIPTPVELDSVVYRQASAFLSVPAGVPLNLGVAPHSASNSVSDTIFNKSVTLEDGKSYYVIADGLLNGSFDLFSSEAPSSVGTAGNTDFMIYHGSIDAPAVDIFAEEAGANLAEDLAYTSFNSAVTEVANADYNIQVRNDASTATVATYGAPLQTLGLSDQTLLVMASGYLTPTVGQPDFGLFAVLNDGTVQPLPTAAARAQVIHNVPLDAAATVDVWVNGALALPGVEYQKASAFIDFPAGLNNTVELKVPGSGANDAAIYSQDITTEARESYYVIASGDGSNESIALRANTGAREVATSGAGNVDFQVFHGSTTAPAVDVFVEDVGGNIAEDLVFGNFSAYAEVAEGNYNVQVRNDASTATVGAYGAPLATLNLEDQAFIVVASGYLGASADSAFILLAVLADGSVVPLPTVTSRAQIVHNVAVVGPVDIWLNGTLTSLQGVDFRQASPFIDFPAGLGQVVEVKAAGSSANDAAAITATLDTEARNKYYVVAAGGADAQALELHVSAAARETALDGANTDVMVYHGSTNAPVVDIWENSTVNAELVNNLTYSNFEGYLELPTADYVLQVRGEDGAEPGLFQYAAPLDQLALNGESILVIASGVVGASDDTGFGLFAIQADGTVTPLPESTVNVNELVVAGLQTYPNPVKDVLRIEFAEAEALDFQLFSTDGRLVKSGVVNNNSQIDMSAFSAGTYVLTLSNNTVSSALSVIKK